MPADHFTRLRRLLEMESDAEAARLLERSRRLTPAEAEERGNTLVDLAIVEEDAGMGGRYLVRLVKRRRTPLPWTRLDVGSNFRQNRAKVLRLDRHHQHIRFSSHFDVCINRRCPRLGRELFAGRRQHIAGHDLCG